MNIKNIDKLDIHKVVEDANKWYDEHGRDEKFVMLEKTVLIKNNAYYNYVFARDVRGADIKSFENAILKSHNHKYIYYFGRDVEQSSYKIIINKDREGNQVFYVLPTSHMPANKEEELIKFWKDVKFRYNTHGLFVVEIEDKGALFYYDEYTKERVKRVIDSQRKIEPLFLFYSVQLGNYKLVKTLLDYDNFAEVNYRPFKLTDRFNTSSQTIVAHRRPYSSLAEEAIFTNREIFKLIETRIEEHERKEQNSMND